MEAGRITARTALALLLATWPRRLLLALLLLVPVLVSASGGLRPADPPPLGIAPEVPTDTGAYVVVPRSYFVSELVDAGSLDEGVRWVGAVAQITNQGSEPISVTGSDETFRLPSHVPNDGLDAPYEVLRLDTGGRLSSAQPGVTYEVALLWRTTGLEDPPPTLTLTLHETAWTRWTIEAGFSSWRATADRSEVALPLGDPPAAILLEEDE